MILLTASTTLQVLLAAAVATNQADLYAVYADIADDGSAWAPGEADTATNGTTAVAWVGSPTSGKRQIKYLSLYNNDTASITATVRYSTPRKLLKVVLAPGERLEYTDGRGFRVLSATGAEKGATSTSSSAVDGVTALAIVSGVVAVDLAFGANRNFTLLLNANVTGMTFSNPPPAGYVGEVEIEIKQDGTGGRTLALPASFHALGGSDTTPASAANAATLLSAKTFDQGTTWRYAMQESA